MGAQDSMDGFEPSRLDLGDVCSQRGGKEGSRAPEDTVILFCFLWFYVCSCSKAVFLMFWYYNDEVLTAHGGSINAHHIYRNDYYVFK